MMVFARSGPKKNGLHRWSQSLFHSVPDSRSVDAFPRQVDGITDRSSSEISKGPVRLDYPVRV
jgi:hypothetical protein